MQSQTTEPASKVLVSVVVVMDKTPAPLEPVPLEPSTEPLHGAIASYLPKQEYQSPQDHWKPIQGGHLQ